MSGGGSANGAPTTVTNELPSWVNSASKDAYDRMLSAVNRGYQPYAGDTVAGMTGDHTAAFDRIRGVQGQADPSYATALGLAGNLAQGAGPTSAADIEALRGQFANPFQQDVVNRSVATLEDQAQRGSNARAAQAGNVGAFGGSRYGVEQGVAAGETARASGDIAGQLNLAGYNTSLQTALGLNSQNKAQAMAGLQMLPQIAGARSQQAATEAGWLQGVGNAQQGQQQAELNDAYRRWQEANDYDRESAALLGQTISGLPYGSTQTTQTTGLKKNKLAGAISGASTGASIGASTGNPYAAAGGAVAGGLMGYFG
jgi:hypothetical protein